MFDLDTVTLTLGLLFGAFGLGFFVYGKSQGALVAMVSGILLMSVPMFISDATVLAVVGVVLVVVPFFVRV